MSSPLPPLRPMTAGDILDTAIRIYRQNFVRLVGIVAIVNVPVLLLTVLVLAVTTPLTGDFSNFSSISSSPAALALRLIQYAASLIAAFLAIFINGALAAFVSERFLGNTISIREAYGRAFKRWLSLIIAVILLALVYVAVFLVPVGLFVIPIVGIGALGVQNNGAMAALLGIASLCACGLFIPLILLAIFLYTRWAFFIPAIVLENYNSTGGLGRSWKLSKGSFWRVLLINAVLTVIVYILSAGPIYLFTILSLTLGFMGLALIGGSVVASLVVMLFTPIQYAALTILYYDLRIRKEGFDLQMQLQSSERAPDLPSLTSGAPAA